MAENLQHAQEAIREANALWQTGVEAGMIELRRSTEPASSPELIHAIGTNAYQAAHALSELTYAEGYVYDPEEPETFDTEVYTTVENAVKSLMRRSIQELRAMENVSRRHPDLGISVQAVRLPEYEGFEKCGDVVLVSFADPAHPENEPITFARFGGDMRYEGDSYQYGINLPTDTTRWLSDKTIDVAQADSLSPTILQGLYDYLSSTMRDIPEAEDMLDTLYLQLEEIVPPQESEEVVVFQSGPTEGEQQTNLGIALEHAFEATRTGLSQEQMELVLAELDTRKPKNCSRAEEVLRTLGTGENVVILVTTKKQKNGVDITRAEIVSREVADDGPAVSMTQVRDNQREYVLRGGKFRLQEKAGKMVLTDENDQTVQDGGFIIDALAHAATLPPSDFRWLIKMMHKLRTGEEFTPSRRSSGETQTEQGLLRDVTINLHSVLIPAERSLPRKELERSVEYGDARRAFVRFFMGQMRPGEIYTSLVPAVRKEIIRHAQIALDAAQVTANNMLSSARTVGKRSGLPTEVNGRVGHIYAPLVARAVRAGLVDRMSVQEHPQYEDFMTEKEAAMRRYAQKSEEETPVEVLPNAYVLHVILEDVMRGVFKIDDLQSYMDLRDVSRRITEEEIITLLSVAYGKPGEETIPALAKAFQALVDEKEAQ